jgi:hypothetical protein
MLALLDAPFAIPPATPLTIPATDVPAQPQLAGRFLADAARSLGWETADLPDPATSTAAQQLAWLAGRLHTDGAGVNADHGPNAGHETETGAVAARLRDRFDVFQAHSRMLAGYQPAIPPLQAPTLIVSADDSPNAPARAHWPRVLTGPVSTLRVDGDHYTFLRPPLIVEVSASILKWHAAGT